MCNYHENYVRRGWFLKKIQFSYFKVIANLVILRKWFLVHTASENSDCTFNREKIASESNAKLKITWILIFTKRLRRQLFNSEFLAQASNESELSRLVN